MGRVTSGNQQRLSVHGRSDPSKGAKWEPGRKELCVIQGLLVLRPAWPKLPLGRCPPPPPPAICVIVDLFDPK